MRFCERIAQCRIYRAGYDGQWLLRDSECHWCEVCEVQAAHTLLASLFPVEKQDFLQAVSVGYEAIPVHGGPGFVPVLSAADSFQKAA